MATNIKRSQDIYLQRFAYDVFKYSALKFEAPEVCMTKWVGVENKYGRPDFITVLSRIIFNYQIPQRTNWCCLFFVRYFINKFASFEELSNASQVVLEFSRKEAGGCVFHEVLVSLALISELIRYLYNISSKMYMQELAAFWTEYFCCYLRKNFEEAGGFAVMYERFNQPKYDSLDIFYNEFIPKFCPPYEDCVVLPHIYDTFYDESRKYYEKITKNLSKEEKHKYNVVFNATVFRPSRRPMPAKEILRLILPTEIGAFATTLPQWNTTENTDKSIQAFRDFNTGDAATSCFPTTRPKEETEYIGSPAELQELKSQPSLGSIVDDFFKLNLASPKMKISNKPEKAAFGIQPPKKAIFGIPPPKKAPFGIQPPKKDAFGIHPPEDSLGDTGASVGYAATSSHNLPDARRQEIAMETRELPIQAEGLKTKSSSCSTGEVSEQLNLGSSKTEPESLLPHGSDVQMEEFNKRPLKIRCVRSTISVENITSNVSFKNHLLDSWHGENVVTSFRNLLATHIQASEPVRSSSQLEGRKRRPTFDPSMEDFDQLDLGQPELKHFREAGSAGFAIGPESLAEKNELVISSLKEAKERRGSSSQLEEGKRKHSSSSSPEDSDQPNLGPSEMEHSLEPVIGSKSLAEKNELAISKLIEAGKRRRSSSQLEGFKMKPSYLPSTKSIDQSDSGPSEMDFSCEPGSSGLVIGSESLAEKNELAISRLKEARKRTESSSQLEERKRKRSSSSPEDSDQSNSGPSDKRYSREPESAGIAVGSESLAEKNELLQEDIFQISCKYFMNYLLRFDLHERAKNQEECDKIDEVLRKKGFLAPTLDSQSPWYEKVEKNEGEERLI